MNEISIGEFARRSRLSLKALRRYDELGVLVPSRVDQGSGYRYYDPAQLDQARLVVMLRQLQLPLAAEPAHREAFARVPGGAGGISPEHFELATESLWAWAREQGLEDERHALEPGDLGLRITFAYTGPVTDPVPDYDVAVPFL